MSAAIDTRPFQMSPSVVARDPLAAYWIGQVNARLRRELAWAWHERGVLDGSAGLPPFTDRAARAVDLVRRWDEKRAFFAEDPAGRYLSERIAAPEPKPARVIDRGSFSWVCAALELQPIDRFWLALAVCGATDAAVGSVMAACANDPVRTRPTLALAQLLWDEPGDVTRLADLAHPVHRTGLVSFASTPHLDWDAAVVVPATIAARLVGTSAAAPASLEPCATSDEASPEQAALLAVALPDRLRVVPVHATRGDAEAAASATACLVGRPVLRVRDELAAAGREQLDALAGWAWLAGVDLFLPEAFVIDGRAMLPRESIPITVYVEAGESTRRACAPERMIAASLRVPALDYEGRVAAWTMSLGDRAAGAERAIAECARRYRIGRAAIARTARAIPRRSGPVTASELGAACRLDLRVDFGDLAEAIEPRFEPDDLVLPPPARRGFDEILAAMRALTEVHHSWGTAHAWRSAGISVLFAGPSGTGKTMAAECLARALDLPLYRVDVSQVVDKYVGETEKNLKRVFDAAERGDLVLFLDEAESIFGRRMDARSAQDRWANLEISYLLTRMETARGLTILATNRKDDFDSAFLRRLRYVIQFPLPDAEARLRIWRQCVPPAADASHVDLELLARRFPLSGGQIRSIMFNACLQSASSGERRLAMDAVVIAVWRELQKHEGTAGLSQFGPYADLIRSLEASR